MGALHPRGPLYSSFPAPLMALRKERDQGGEASWVGPGGIPPKCDITPLTHPNTRAIVVLFEHSTPTHLKEEPTHHGEAPETQQRTQRPSPSQRPSRRPEAQVKGAISSIRVPCTLPWYPRRRKTPEKLPPAPPIPLPSFSTNRESRAGVYREIASGLEQSKPSADREPPMEEPSPIRPALLEESRGCPEVNALRPPGELGIAEGRGAIARSLAPVSVSMRRTAQAWSLWRTSCPGRVRG